MSLEEKAAYALIAEASGATVEDDGPKLVIGGVDAVNKDKKMPLLLTEIKIKTERASGRGGMTPPDQVSIVLLARAEISGCGPAFASELSPRKCPVQRYQTLTVI